MRNKSSAPQYFLCNSLKDSAVLQWEGTSYKSMNPCHCRSIPFIGVMLWHAGRDLCRLGGRRSSAGALNLWERWETSGQPIGAIISLGFIRKRNF